MKREPHDLIRLAVKRLQAMTPAERLQLIVRAGLVTQEEADAASIRLSNRDRDRFLAVFESDGEPPRSPSGERVVSVEEWEAFLKECGEQE